MILSEQLALPGLREAVQAVVRPENEHSHKPLANVRSEPKDVLAKKLAPSVGPTPRRPSVSSSKRGSSCVMIPSANCLNDAMRVKCLGQRTATKENNGLRRPASAPHLRKAKLNTTAQKVGLSPSEGFRPASAPASPSMMRTSLSNQQKFDGRSGAAVTGLSASRGRPLSAGPARSASAPDLAKRLPTALSQDPRTPRRQRGLVKSAEKIDINYPLFVLDKRVVPQKSQAVPGGAGETQWTPPRPRRVSFLDEEVDEATWAEKNMSPTRKRTSQLLQSLSELRRSSSAADASDETEGVLIATLRECQDTLEGLKQRLETTTDYRCSVGALGGERHATNCVYGRPQQVIERKMTLIGRVDDRRHGMQSTHANCHSISSALVSGDMLETPDELVGITRFIANAIHPDGDPGDANKSDFDAFVSSFRLPAKHDCLLQLKQTSRAVSEWWVSETLRVAKTGKHIDPICRLMNVALGAGSASPEDPRLLDALMICARTMKQEFAGFSDPSGQWAGRPPVGKANHTADLIDRAIMPSLQNGSSSVKKILAEAQDICKDLRQMEGMWKRMLGRQNRMQAASRSSR